MCSDLKKLDSLGPLQWYGCFFVKLSQNNKTVPVATENYFQNDIMDS